MKFEKVMDQDERILIQKRPDRFLYILGTPIFYVIAVVWFILDWNMMRFMFEDVGHNIGEVCFMLLHLLPVWIAIFGPIYRACVYHTVEYAITNRRIYLTSGIFGQDFTTVEYREIQNLKVNVNPLEKMRNVGTIQLVPSVGSEQHRKPGIYLLHIDDPYETYKKIKQLSLDVSSDQMYPNAYRPQENPGYHTDITDKK